MTFLLRITYANLAYALLLRLRGPVTAWRIELPPLLARPFDMLKPYRLFSRDEWLLLYGRCFDAWRERVLPAFMREHRCVDRCGGIEVDFSRNAWQILAQEYERLYLFAAAAQRASPEAAPRIVAPWIARAIGYEALRAQFPQVAFHRSRLNDLGEFLYEWVLSAAHLGRSLQQFLRGFAGPRIDPGPRRILWTGISPQEMASEPDKLHFGWAAAYGHVPAKDVLYFPPAAPGPRQASFLASQGILTVAPNELFRLLPAAARLQLLVAGWRAAARGLFLDSATIGPLRARFMSRAPLWHALARQLRSHAYVTSTSASWPERPEVAALKSAGLRTVIWSYSANMLWFANSAAGFRDLSVTRSILITDEFWVWSNAVRRHFEHRQATGAIPLPRIEVTGAMMCGNAAHLALAPAAARRRLGLPEGGFYISVFDVPTPNEAWRRRFGGGPVAIETEFGEAFFAGLLALLEALPAVNLILKFKRRIGDRFRDFPPALFALIEPDGRWMRERRIEIVDVNCDPYLPIAAGDASLGMPCSSPVLAALACGRPAAYFDPLRKVGFSAEPSVRDLVLQTQAGLQAAVAGWLQGSRPVPRAPAVLSVDPAWSRDPRLFLFPRQPSPVTE